MENLEKWRETQLEEIQAFLEEAKQWQTQLKKDVREWKNALLREANSAKEVVGKSAASDLKAAVRQWVKATTQEMSSNREIIQAEIDAMRGDAADGNTRVAGEGASAKNLLGSTDGEGDQTEADDTAGRKGRRRTSGTK